MWRYSNSMLGSRLSDLSLIAIERDFNIDYQELVDAFVVQHKNSHILLEELLFIFCYLISILFISEMSTGNFSYMLALLCLVMHPPCPARYTLLKKKYKSRSVLCLVVLVGW